MAKTPWFNVVKQPPVNGGQWSLYEWRCPNARVRRNVLKPKSGLSIRFGACPHCEWRGLTKPAAQSSAEPTTAAAPQPSAEPAATVQKSLTVPPSEFARGVEEGMAIGYRNGRTDAEWEARSARVIGATRTSANETIASDPVQPSAEPTTECTTCGATVVRVTGVYDYPPPGDELVQAARDALACMREYSSEADEDCGDPGCD